MAYHEEINTGLILVCLILYDMNAVLILALD